MCTIFNRNSDLNGTLDIFEIQSHFSSHSQQTLLLKMKSQWCNKTDSQKCEQGRNELMSEPLISFYTSQQWQCLKVCQPKGEVS